MFTLQLLEPRYRVAHEEQLSSCLKSRVLNRGRRENGSVQKSVAHLDYHVDYQYSNLGVPHISEHSREND